ncbi:MAG: chaperonin GroEL [Planctomycetes bacterium]|nr:chaperonin GroEL [Planctomycetota bacterium]
MTAKTLHFRSEAREKLLRGTTALTNAIRVTLGPRSKCVLIERKWGAPLVCNDGVTIAKEFELPDPEENLGVRVLRQAAERTGDAVGDGTSTATLLAHAIYSEGVKNVAAGANAIDLKRGIDRGLVAAIAALKALSRPVKSRKEKVQVATISAHNNPRTGELVADAVEKVGGEGVITVEEAKGTETTLEVVEGMQFDRGWLSGYFVTDAEKPDVVLEDPLILLHEKRITSVKDLLPLLEQAAKSGRPFLIIAEDVEAEALATLVVNRIRGTLACAAVKAPGFGDRRRELLEDMAILTGARMVSADLGIALEHVKLGELGKARRVLISRDHTTIIGGAGKRSAIDARAQQLRTQCEEATSDWDKEKLRERLAKLAGGVAVIRVGAPSETKMKSLKEVFEDAISATKAAVAEAIVPGGGLALIRLQETVLREAVACDGDERTGVRILAKALEAPARQIAENSGVEAGVIVQEMRTGCGGRGFDAARCEWVDLFEAGIIDPTKVLRIALENAASVAGVLLLTEAVLTEIPEQRQEPVAAPTD